MRVVIAILLMLIGLLPCVAGSRPHDVRTLRPVDGYVPEAGALFWDMSNRDVTGEDVEVKISTVSDSVIIVKLPTARFVFTATGDTLRRAVVETRHSLFHDTVAPIVATPLRSTAVVSRAAGRGLAFNHDRYLTASDITLFPDVVGTLALRNGDTIPGMVLRHSIERTLTHPESDGGFPTDTAARRFFTIRERYSWQLPGVRFPLAHTEVVTDSVGGKTGPRRVESWILVEAPEAVAGATAGGGENTVSRVGRSPRPGSGVVQAS